MSRGLGKPDEPDSRPGGGQGSGYLEREVAGRREGGRGKEGGREGGRERGRVYEYESKDMGRGGRIEGRSQEERRGEGRSLDRKECVLERGSLPFSSFSSLSLSLFSFSLFFDVGILSAPAPAPPAAADDDERDVCRTVAAAPAAPTAVVAARA